MARFVLLRRLAAAVVIAAAAGLSLAPTSAISAGPTKPSLLSQHVYPLVGHAKQSIEELGIPSLGSGFGPLMYGSGPIQKVPKVYVTFWGWHGSDPSGEAPYLQSFLSGVGGTGWANIQTQYTGTGQGNITNPTGQLAGVWFDDSSTPLAVTLDAQIANEAVVAEQHFGFNPDADYFVATPSGTGTLGFKTQYCAYHGATSSAQGTVAFTYLPYQTDAGASCGKNFVNPGSAGLLDGVSIVGGHEYAEAVTDPQPSSGWTDLTGAETGDKCAWISSGQGAAQNITVSGRPFAVQSLWSNAAGLLGNCVLTYP